MKEGKEDMPLVGKTMAEGHTHRMAVLCEKLGSTLREILDGTCPQPAKPEKAPKRPALEKYRETYLIPPKIKGPKAVFISEETRSALDMIVLRLGCRGMSLISCSRISPSLPPWNRTPCGRTTADLPSIGFIDLTMCCNHA